MGRSCRLSGVGSGSGTSPAAAVATIARLSNAVIMSLEWRADELGPTAICATSTHTAVYVAWTPTAACTPIAVCAVCTHTAVCATSTHTAVCATYTPAAACTPTAVCATSTHTAVCATCTHTAACTYPAVCAVCTPTVVCASCTPTAVCDVCAAAAEPLPNRRAAVTHRAATSRRAVMFFLKDYIPGTSEKNLSGSSKSTKRTQKLWFSAARGSVSRVVQLLLRLGSAAPLLLRLVKKGKWNRRVPKYCWERPTCAALCPRAVSCLPRVVTRKERRSHSTVCCSAAILQLLAEHREHHTAGRGQTWANPKARRRRKR